MFETLSNNVSSVKKELTLFQLRMLPLALLRAITHLRSSHGTLWAHCQLSTKCLIVHSNRLKPYYGCPKEVETNLTEKDPKSLEKNCT